MRAEVESIVRAAMTMAGAGENYILGASWCSDRYLELCRQIRPRQLRQTGELTTTASIESGTVSATRGSKVVTGDATAVAAWTSACVGRYLRIATAFYRIAQVGALTLTLDSEYSEDDATDSTYIILRRTYSLPVEVRHVGQMVQPRLQQEIANVSLPNLNVEAPERTEHSGLISAWTEVGVDPETGGKLVEFYPTPDAVELIRYTYWEQPEELSLASSLPPFIDKDVLQKGVLASALAFKAGQLAERGDKEGAAFFLNWSSREETVWNAKVRSAALASKATDDSTVQLLRTPGGSSTQQREIRTARDHVYANWTPLS